MRLIVQLVKLVENSKVLVVIKAQNSSNFSSWFLNIVEVIIFDYPS